MVRRRAEELLETMLGSDQIFRDGQWEAIESVVGKKERTLLDEKIG
jgi:superfamily II DNA helicase RecQ